LAGTKCDPPPEESPSCCFTMLKVGLWAAILLGVGGHTDPGHFRVSLAASADPPKLVKHRKSPGDGHGEPGRYRKGSPLYSKQQRKAEAKDQQPTLMPGMEGFSTMAPMNISEPNAPLERHFDDREFTASCQTPIPPVSTSIQCVVWLVVQFFSVYLLLAIARTVLTFSRSEGFLRVMQCATATADLAPMLAILFVAARMRALYLSKGNPKAHDLPPDWVQFGMWGATLALFGQLILVLLCAVMSGRAPGRGAATNPKEYFPGGGLLCDVLNVSRFFLMGVLFSCALLVGLGVIFMEAPEKLWGAEKTVPVSPAIDGTLALAVAYLTFNGAFQVADAVVEKGSGLQRQTMKERIVQGLDAGVHAIAIAPMVCILFLIHRLRATQVDPKGGDPQEWAAWVFTFVVVAVTLHAVLAFAALVVARGYAVKGAPGDVRLDFGESASAALASKVAQLFFLVAIYGGAILILVSLLTLEHRKGPAKTPPMSPTIICCVCLALQFFTIYSLLMTAVTVKMFRDNSSAAYQSGFDSMLAATVDSLKAALSTVLFAPMLAVLVIAVRIRALQITNRQGAPPVYAQDAMYVVVIALAFQLILILVLPCFVGVPKNSDEATGEDAVSVNEDGGLHVVHPRLRWVGMAFDALRYLFLLALYGSIIVLILAIFYMDCNNTQGFSLAPKEEPFTFPTPAPFETMTLSPEWMPGSGSESTKGSSSSGSNWGSSSSF